MADTPRVAANKVVFMHYTLRNSEGAEIDSSRGGQPMPYLQGAGAIVPGLERQMEGRALGERFEAVVPPAEGYGVREAQPMPVPREHLPADVELAPGMQLMGEDDNGHRFPIWVAKVEGDTVWMDLEHPLVDVTLHFDIEIVSLRDASEEEIAHGHPHLPGMHHH
ncbi:MAG: peptidylprolyl isomerase [Pseudomonadota bacterium]